MLLHLFAGSQKMKRGLVKQNLNLVGMLLKRGKECSYLQTFIFVKRNYNKKSIKKNEMTWKLKKKKSDKTKD